MNNIFMFHLIDKISLSNDLITFKSVNGMGNTTTLGWSAISLISLMATEELSILNHLALLMDNLKMEKLMGISEK